MTRLVSPRQAAQSMGVSESSLKRWCDRGVLRTQRTAGGHRKIPVSSVVRFLRESRRELVSPELIGLPSRLQESAKPLAVAVESVASSLISGDMEACQRIAFGCFLSGRTLPQICDELLTPALALIGDRWNRGDVEIFEEHRAVEMTLKLLHEFRVTTEPARQTAPVAMGGTADGDSFSLPTQMIELALLEVGWNAVSLGPSLPFETLLSAIRRNEPKLFWLSVSAIVDGCSFLERLNRFNEEAAQMTSVFVGGRALTLELQKKLQFAKYCGNIQQLVANARTMHCENAGRYVRDLVSPTGVNLNC